MSAAPRPTPRWRKIMAFFISPLAGMILILLLAGLGIMDDDEAPSLGFYVGLGVVYALLLAAWSFWLGLTAFLLHRLRAAWEARWILVSAGIFGAIQAAVVVIVDDDFRNDAGFGAFMAVFLVVMNLAMALAFKFLADLPWRTVSNSAVEDVFN